MATESASSVLNRSIDWEAAFKEYSLKNNLNQISEDYAKFANEVLATAADLRKEDVVKLVALEKKISLDHPITAKKIHNFCVLNLVSKKQEADLDQYSLQYVQDLISHFFAYIWSKCKPGIVTDFSLKSQKQALAMQYFVMLPEEQRTPSNMKKCLNLVSFGTLNEHELIFSLQGKNPKLPHIIGSILQYIPEYGDPLAEERNKRLKKPIQDAIICLGISTDLVYIDDKINILLNTNTLTELLTTMLKEAMHLKKDNEYAFIKAFQDIKNTR